MKQFFGFINIFREYENGFSGENRIAAGLLGNSGIYIAGSFLQKLIIFLLIPVYTYFLLPGDFGIIGLAATIEGVLAILLSFGLRSSITRYYYDFIEDLGRLKAYITICYVFLIISGTILTLVFSIYGENLWNSITSGQIAFFPYVTMVLWSAMGMVVQNYVTSLYQAQQNAGAYVIAQLGSVLFNLALTILFVVIFPFGAFGQIFGRMVSSLVMALVLSAFLLRNWFTSHLYLVDLKSALVFGFPLIFHALFSWAVSSIDRIMLEPYISLEELGFYTLGCQIGGVLTALLVSVNQAWIPFYYSLMAKVDDQKLMKIRSITDGYIIIFGFICLVATLLNKQILQVMSSPKYQSASVYVPIILFSALFSGYYFMFSSAIFHHKKTLWIPMMTGLTALINIGLNMVLIPSYGAMGSAWATLVSYVVLALVSYFMGQKLQHVRYPIIHYLVINMIIFLAVLVSTYPIFIGRNDLLIKLTLVILFFLAATSFVNRSQT